jgi:hypothetical protein
VAPASGIIFDAVSHHFGGAVILVALAPADPALTLMSIYKIYVKTVYYFCQSDCQLLCLNHNKLCQKGRSRSRRFQIRIKRFIRSQSCIKLMRLRNTVINNL